LERLGLDLEEALLSLDRLAVRRIFAELAILCAPAVIGETVIAGTLERIGAGWEEGRVALSQVYMSGRLCEELMESILPPTGQRRIGQPKMAIACLEDHHSLGKRIVYSALRASGYELLDYGHGIEAGRLVELASHDDVEVLLVSVLMLRSALKVTELRAGLDAVSPGVRIVVGGAPFRFDSQLWTQVGADAMGSNAAEAMAIVSRWIEGR